MKRRLRIGIIFGGRSVEHEVSLVSARSVLAAIDPDRYEVVPIGVTRAGKWLTSTEVTRFLDEGVAKETGEHTALVGDPSVSGLVPLDGDGQVAPGRAATLSTGASGTGEELLAQTMSQRERHARQSAKLDVVFPLIHGNYGEDGKLQGLLEMADLAYVGSGVLGSALGMDKEVAKRLLRAAGIAVVDALVIRAHEWPRATADATRSGGREVAGLPLAPPRPGAPAQAPLRHGAPPTAALAGEAAAPRAWESSGAALEAAVRARIENELGYPCFVKPACLGSSVGVSRARTWDEARRAVSAALGFDEKVLVERAVDAREIEVAVLGNERPEASVVGEIVTSREFYDYEAKYHDSTTKLVIPAAIPAQLSERVRAMAVEAFGVLELSGLARVDYLLDRVTGQPFLNEVNTIPGFTPVSMYPKLWEASGLSYPDLVDRLIQLACERHEAKKRLRTSRDGGAGVDTGAVRDEPTSEEVAAPSRERGDA